MMLKQIKNRVAKFKRDESGATAIEYAIMAAVLVVAIIVAVGLLDFDGMFGEINAKIDTELAK